MSDRFAIVGAGQMGNGIAHVCATSGFPVTLIDVAAEALAKGRATIERNLDRQVKKGSLDAAAKDAALGRITTSTALDGVEGATVVVEAATERKDLKFQIFRDLDRLAGQEAILATNTSSISITEIAAVTTRPGQVIGMHFMNPVPLMKLVEVIRALQTADATYNVAMHLAERLNKTVVTVKDSPAFIVNRVLIPMLNEACFALQEGVGTPEDIDTAVKLGLNHPMGPLQLADFIGLDTVVAIAEVLQHEFGDDKYRPANILRQHVAAGWLGAKSGRGFYRYENGQIKRAV